MSDLLGHNNPPKRKLKTDLDVAVFHMLKLDKENQVLQSRLDEAEKLIGEVERNLEGIKSAAINYQLDDVEFSENLVMDLEKPLAKIKTFKEGK